MNGVEGMEKEQREMSKRMNGQAISDCCMVAAKSFCGIEQTTARVEPVAIISPRRRLFIFRDPSLF
jgi:hypothetical protein